MIWKKAIGEEEDLDIQAVNDRVRNKSKKKRKGDTKRKKTMKHRHIWGIMLLIYLFAYGCAQRNISAVTETEDRELTRKEEINYQYAFTEGIKQKIKGNLREAIPYFMECIRINEKSDAAFYELGSILTMAGNYEEAAKYMKQAGKIDPQNVWYQLQIASLYHAMGMRDSTLLMYEEMHKNYPERTDLYFNLATLHGEYGDEKRAINIFNELEEQYGANETILLAKQQIYAKSGELDKAIDEVLKLIDAYPDEVRFYGILAELYWSGKQDEKALETYEKLFRIDPENGLGQLSMIEYYKRKGNQKELFEMVNKLIDNDRVEVNQKIQVMIQFFTNEENFSKNQEKIGRAVESLAKNYPDDTRVRTLKADYHVKNDEFEKAAVELRFVTQREKTNFVIWEQLLFVENSIEEYERLYHEAAEAIELFPGAPTVYLLRGIAAIELGKNGEAIKALQEGLGCAEENRALIVQLYSLLGEAYKNDGNNQMSDNSFDKALELDNENLLVLNNYSYYLSLREERLEEALEMSKKCIEQEPNNSTYLDTYGWILFKMKRYELAKEYIEKAIKNSGTTSSEIVEHYGDILMIFGEREKAVKQWKRALELGGTKEELEKKIEKAERE